MEFEEVGDPATVDDAIERVAKRAADDETEHRIAAQVARLAKNVDRETDRHRQRGDQEEPGADRNKPDGRARVAYVVDPDHVTHHGGLRATNHATALHHLPHA